MISVTILTKNSQKYLTEVLRALERFDEVVIYDTGSKDDTLQIARKFSNVSIYENVFCGFGPTHNQASLKARHDWILSIDSDEVVTEELVREVFELELNLDTVYSIPRKNIYNGKWIKGCGWYPDRQIKLYNRTKTRYTEALVHESVISENFKVLELKKALIHYSYKNIFDFLGKMQSYSELFSKQNVGRKKSSPKKALLHALFAFFKSYFLKRGFLDGAEGFEISIYNANTAFYKYLKLYEANKRLKEEDFKEVAEEAFNNRF